MAALIHDINSEYIRLFPEEATRFIERLSFDEALEVILSFPVEDCAALFTHANISISQQWLSALPLETTGNILSLIPSDLTAIFVRRLPMEVRPKLLESLPQNKRAMLSQSLDYPPGTIGSVTDPVVLSVPDDVPIEVALEQIRDAEDYRHDTVYVTNREQNLVGVLTLRDLIVAHPGQQVNSVMSKPGYKFEALVNRKAIESVIEASNNNEFPVIDASQHLVGILRTSTLARIAGSSDEPVLEQPISLLASFAELFWTITSSLLPNDNINRS